MDHEKDFETAFKGISIFITFLTFSIFVLAHMIESGAGFNFSFNEEFGMGRWDWGIGGE